MAKFYRNWQDPNTLIVYRVAEDDGTNMPSHKIIAEYQNGTLCKRTDQPHNMTIEEVENATDGSIDDSQYYPFVDSLNLWSAQGTTSSAPSF